MTGIWRLMVVTFVIAGLYLILDAVVVFVFNPIQSLFLPDITRYSSLVYLPFALRVLSTSLLGAEAIPGLFIGMLVSSLCLWGVSEPDLLLSLSLVGSLSTWLVFRAIAPLGVDAFYLASRPDTPPLNTYLLAGLLTAMLDAFLMIAVLESDAKIKHVASNYASLVIGALSGLVLGWYLGRLFLPLVNRVFRPDEPS